MSSAGEYDEYLTELREQVCSRCIVRHPDTPPCSSHGIGCGIERHLQELVELCRTTDSALRDLYIEKLHDTICKDCEFRNKPACPCPLDYLLLLAEAIERVERRRASRNGAEATA
jgi:hypothetical protein